MTAGSDRSAPGAIETLGSLDARAFPPEALVDDGTHEIGGTDAGSAGSAEAGLSPTAVAAIAKRQGAFRGKAPDAKTRGVPAAKLEIASAKRRVVAKVLRDARTSGAELPLEFMLENMRWAATRARKLEDDVISAPEGTEVPPGVWGAIADYREHAQAAAVAAAPYLHARLAPITPKGEKGLTVNLVIEDA